VDLIIHTAGSASPGTLEVEVVERNPRYGTKIRQVGLKTDTKICGDFSPPP